MEGNHATVLDDYTRILDVIHILDESSELIVECNETGYVRSHWGAEPQSRFCSTYELDYEGDKEHCYIANEYCWIVFSSVEEETPQGIITIPFPMTMIPISLIWDIEYSDFRASECFFLSIPVKGSSFDGIDMDQPPHLRNRREIK